MYFDNIVEISEKNKGECKFSNTGKYVTLKNNHILKIYNSVDLSIFKTLEIPKCKYLNLFGMKDDCEISFSFNDKILCFYKKEKLNFYNLETGKEKEFVYKSVNSYNMQIQSFEFSKTKNIFFIKVKDKITCKKIDYDLEIFHCNEKITIEKLIFERINYGGLKVTNTIINKEFILLKDLYVKKFFWHENIGIIFSNIFVCVINLKKLKTLFIDYYITKTPIFSNKIGDCFLKDKKLVTVEKDIMSIYDISKIYEKIENQNNKKISFCLTTSVNFLENNLFDKNVLNIIFDHVEY